MLENKYKNKSFIKIIFLDWVITGFKFAIQFINQIQSPTELQQEKMYNRIHPHQVSLMTFHKALLPYFWSIVIDIAIFLPFLVQYKYSLIIHMIMGGLVSLTTIVTSYTSMIRGLPQDHNRMYFHKLFGMIICGLIVIEFIIGLISFLLKATKKTSPFLVLYLRWAHTYLGYAIAIMAKIQTINFLKSGSPLSWFNIIWDILFIIVYLKRTFTHQKIENTSPRELKNNYYIESSLNFEPTEQSQNIQLIYGNEIYDGRNVANNHPGGKEVILAIKDKCIERYLYGAEPLENFPALPLYSHSAQSIVLLGTPIAKINIQVPYKNFQNHQYQVQSISVSTISEKANVNVYMLKLKTQKTIEFCGYSYLQQLGRYYALTNSKGITRLYTTVSFLHNKNVHFINKCLGGIIQVNFNQAASYEAGLQQQIEQKLRDKDQIPLLIKIYQGGRFTKDLKMGDDEKMILSETKGKGLELNKIAKGTVIFVSGGTGLNPFCDTIDILFKSEFIKIYKSYSQQALQQNPILNSTLFEGIKFIFMVSVKNIEEIHPVIRRQLIWLAQNDKIQLKIKVKEEFTWPVSVQRVTGSFEQSLTQTIKHKAITKVYICGPPRMNKECSQVLQNLNFHNYTLL